MRTAPTTTRHGRTGTDRAAASTSSTTPATDSSVRERCFDRLRLRVCGLTLASQEWDHAADGGARGPRRSGAARGHGPGSGYPAMNTAIVVARAGPTRARADRQR